jgi:hypothetical protein
VSITAIRRLLSRSNEAPLLVLICSINYAPELVAAGKDTGEMGKWLAARVHDARGGRPFSPGVGG